MATTDQRAGFRLPWTTDQRPSADETDTTAPVDADTDGDVAVDADGQRAEGHREAATGDGAAHTGEAGDTTHTATAGPDAVDHQATETETVPAETATAPTATIPGKKPSKYLADLTKAMQATAESARSQTLGQAQADAKAHIEDIHSRSATDASELRKRADDDVAGIREWSKAEIARVRDETERRIAGRKGELEGQLERHAGVIEQEIERVQGQLSMFEGEMVRFYDHLLAEEDPTKFASLFENLPEPPLFSVSTVDLDAIMAGAAGTAAVVAEPVEAAEPEATEATMIGTAEAEAAPEVVADTEPLIGATSAEDHNGYTQQSNAERETAMVAIQAAFEAAAQAEADAGRAEAAAERAESVAGSLADGDAGPAESQPAAEGEAASTADAEAGQAEADPRTEATGLTDLDAAEAEAAAAASASSEEIPTLDDDALAARLDGLVPEHRAAPEPAAASNANEMKTTQVVVVGLVSVASIASFKRHLGRISGVRSVGVSSGPDGEFVFSATHGQTVVLRDAIPTLPGFQARVTNTGDGIINVTAHDPESEG
ncbi:MAG: hypothetical protein ACHQ3P_02080 [Candidatus Limnocylindrales bacterium]